jgi:hypothetical protein
VRLIRYAMHAERQRKADGLELPEQAADPRPGHVCASPAPSGSSMARRWNAAAHMRHPWPVGGGQGRLNFSRREIESSHTRDRRAHEQTILHACGDHTLATLLDAARSVHEDKDWPALRLRVEHADGMYPDLAERPRDWASWQ